jgi:hypothetical protein
MAIRRSTAPPPAWAAPAWPDPLPAASSMRAIYGAYADELVVRFPSELHHETIVVPIATPDVEYAGLLVAMSSGDVIGVHVYPLAAYGVKQHPEWERVTAEKPEPDSVAELVEDIRGLFDQYGIEPDDPGLD